MSDIDLVHCFYLGGKLFLTPGVRLTGLVIIHTWRSLSLVFGIYLTGLFENPTIPVGGVHRLIGCAMNLTGPLKDFVHARWTVPVAFERFLPLAGFRDTKSGIDCRIVCVVVVVPMFIFIAARFTIAIPGLRSVGVARAVASTSQPAIFTRIEAGHKCS